MIGQFESVWAVDFEFIARSGERQEPVCLVARELQTGTTIRQWRDEMGAGPPYAIDRDSVLVSYFASAELGCHLALGWPLPHHVVDLYAEFRNHTNGLPVPGGNGLLGALTWFGLDSMAAAEKTEMRDLILRGGPWSGSERRAILDYCARDVTALEMLLPAMERIIDLPRALLRGRYMKAVARMEYAGVPIDTDTLAGFQTNWDAIRGQLIERVGADYGVFDGLTFRANRWEAWLSAHGIPWPRLASGQLDLQDSTFREMAKAYPEVAPMRELRYTLSQLKLNKLAVGVDHRNRTLISPFGAKSGRNTPSNAKSIFGPSVWLRHLIKPEVGRAVAYVDWSQQELGIAAALSGDGKMIEAYRSGDFYLAFAKQAGAAPPTATKTSHAKARELFKTCSLGLNYGMGADSMAQRIGEPPAKARELIRLHKETYREFWRWSDSAIDYFNLHGCLWTVFGWHLRGEARESVLRNFPMQANGAEMLRLACCYLTEADIQVCMPVHDAVLIEGPIADIDDIIAETRRLMAQASGDVLAGFELRTDVEVIRYPDRYQDKRGVKMWQTVMQILSERLHPDATPAVAARANGVLQHGVHLVLL